MNLRKILRLFWPLDLWWRAGAFSGAMGVLIYLLAPVACSIENWPCQMLSVLTKPLLMPYSWVHQPVMKNLMLALGGEEFGSGHWAFPGGVETILELIDCLAFGAYWFLIGVLAWLLWQQVAGRFARRPS